ncbi:TonB-dependent receptor [Desulfobacter curvatus]|uniref:TonB-dependent receptor n=1 Tax=Desulfobacter curvatus TaxID=2290 RepID=UPI000362FC31|nr:TonB-dependent receptor [Desulfobacter curvatus]
MKRIEKGLKKLKRKIALIAVASLILSQNIYADENPQKLDSITVTAQKTEENIQEVPISMTVFDEVTIEDKKIESIKDIAPYTSNFVLLDKGSGYSAPSIRGISNTITTLSSNNMSVMVDGIPVSYSHGFNETLMDIERVEVLKGPQGTLYGKEAQAGVINVITKKPDNETMGKIGVELGEDNKRQYTLSVNGPIVEDKLFVGVSAKHYEKDGFVKNTLLGEYNDKENNYGKAHLRYTPSDNLEMSLISSKLKYDNKGKDYVGAIISAGDRSLSTDVLGYDKSSITSHALKVSYDINDYLLESITTYRNIKTDALRASANYDHDHNEEHDKYAQEFRISNSSDPFKWVAGVYTDKDEDENSSSYIYPTFVSPVRTTEESDSVGVFIHTDYAINDKFSFISGVRYDKDNKEYEDKTTNTKLELSNNEISPKVSLKYQHNQESMYYTTISKGYRAGGFWTYAPSGYSPQYDEETLWNYEIGAKNSFFDNRLIVNAAIFYMKIDDMQVKVHPIAGSTQAYIDNAAKATSKGFEIELQGKLTDTIELFGTYGYTNVTFDDYKDSNGDYSGNKNIFAPEYNYSIGIQYRDTNGYFARVDVNGYGETYFDKENENSRDAYHLVNAKIGYETEHYDIYLYGKNIFDKEYNSVSMFGGGGIIYSPPREIGVQLTYRF